MGKLTLGAALAVAATLAVPVSAQDPLEDARAALEEYFRAWNAEDNNAIAAACNYPRLSLGRNGQVTVREGPADVVTDFERLRQTEGWDHSTIDRAEPMQVAPDTRCTSRWCSAATGRTARSTAPCRPCSS